MSKELEEYKANNVALKEAFDKDTIIVAEQTVKFIENVYPAYLYNNKQEILNLTYEKSDDLLKTFTFFKIASCVTEEVEDLFEFLNEKMNRFYTALYSVGKPIVYGVVSYDGVMDIIIGLYDTGNDSVLIRSIMEGLLDNVVLTPYKINKKISAGEKEVGLISGIPSVKVDEGKQKFSLAAMMKSLNGQNFTVLFISRPLSQENIAKKYSELIQIKDQCFAISKRNISRQEGVSKSVGESKTRNTTTSTSSSFGIAFILSLSESESITTSDSYSKTITDAVTRNEGISSDVQNGFALEVIDYADFAIERLRQGKNNGMWETVVSYSADTKLVEGIIHTSIMGEFARPNKNILPPAAKRLHLNACEANSNSILIPKILHEEAVSPLCTAVTSEELGLMCTLPDVPVPNFELKKDKVYPLITDNTEGVNVGHVCDGQRTLENMPFALSYKDLARHTFVCGITGSGKTTTVKGILKNAEVPFLVIESAKKEYRNIKLDGKKRPQIFTLGKPEINCLRFNPFYIQCGVTPQMHIDFLKDLFNASFSFYGPMPYILEKCLQNVYKKKGWNLTLGYHPYLVNTTNSVDFFDADYMQNRYLSDSHKYIFPTMQELKAEVDRYIEKEMNYEGEIAGNIKTAIKARLESLCCGTKGYMFNTYEYADMNELLTNNAVFELEGLADDADKAFCVGLIIIFINEYRQVKKETSKENNPLAHLLVIEEAHRLLKNVNTEKTSEDMGNPKGKAVEHFTNMIAEMRSYGQGVIVAEQIPSKLAPDVIKNSSNKIIQRLVATDDQQLVANTIGLGAEESLNLGFLTTGTGLCHKEGMNLPVRIRIPMIEEVRVSDGMLYSGDVEVRLYNINLNTAREALTDVMDKFGLKMLNTILVQDYDDFNNAIRDFRKNAKSILLKKDIELIMCPDENSIYADLLTESLIRYLLNGAYSIKQLISNRLCEYINELLRAPNKLKYSNLREQLRLAYKEDVSFKGKLVVANLVCEQANKNTDILATIKNYFFEITDEDVEEIKNLIYRR